MIALVASGASGDTALGIEFIEGLLEGQDAMGGRGVAKLTVLLESLELAQQVEAQAAGPALGGEETGAAAEDKAEPGNTLDAFVGGGNQEVDGAGLEVDGVRAEAAHGIDDINLVVTSSHLAESLNGIDDPRGGFAMDGGDVRDGRVRGEQLIEGGGVAGDILGGAEDGMGDAGVLEHGQHAFAVGTVGEDGDLAVGGDAGLEDGFDPEGSAALEENGFPARGAAHAGEGQQALADGGDDLVELPVPRACVMQHGLLDAEGSGERAWGEEQFVARGGERSGGWGRSVHENKNRDGN